jgi:hypothetical protein
VEFDWRSRRYRVTVPAVPLPLYLAVAGAHQPPPGQLILVIRRKPGLLDLFRSASRVTEREVEAVLLG